MINRTAIKIPPEALRKAQLKLDEAAKVLKPHLVVLTPSERLSFRKSGAELIKFLELSHNLAVESPGLFPAFINTEVFRNEYLTTHELWILVNKINQLGEHVRDTERLSGNRTLEMAVAFYQTVKMAARRDIPGSKIIFSELRSAFPPGIKKQKKTGEKNKDRQLELFEEHQ